VPRPGLAHRLVRLYPRGWRERYEAEFLAVVGEDALSVQQVIDIVAGAIDARLSSDVRGMSRHPVATEIGGTDMVAWWQTCGRSSNRISTRDAMIGAAVVLGLSLGSAIAGVGLKRTGFPAASEFILSLGFPLSVLLSMPFTYLKGQSWRAQAVLLGPPTAILVLIAWGTVVLSAN
jgi:hypothetical protein